MPHTLTKSWQEFLNHLSQHLPPQEFELWFSTLRPVERSENVLKVHAPSSLHLSKLKERFGSAIEAASREVGIALQFLVDGESHPPSLPLSPPPHPDLNPNFSFAHFVVGEANQFAYFAATAVSEHPGKKYNPLFIYGGVGLGKTHLLHAIGLAVITRHPRYRVLYITAEQLTNEVVNAVRFDKLTELHERFRKRCDLLLLDDVQFLIGKKRTQLEFFYIFNTLYERGKQIVLTSDSPPKDLEEIEARLRSRFESGLIADVHPPGYELRVAILKKKTELLELAVPAEVLEYIAHHVRGSVRELEGALNRLQAKSRFEGKRITLEFARTALREYVRSPFPHLDPDTIIKTVADYFHLKPQNLRSPSRRREEVHARQIAIYLVRKLTSLSLPAIGREFGGRDHTTILHSLKKMEATLKDDHELENLLHFLERSLER